MARCRFRLSTDRGSGLVAALLLMVSGCRGCEPVGETASPEDSPAEESDVQDSPPGDSDDGPTVEELDPWVQPEVWVEPSEVEPGELATVRYQGPLAEREALLLRYGFDGGIAHPSRGDWLGSRDDSGCPDYHLELSMSPSQAGGFEAQVELPADVRTLDLWFEDPETGDEDDAEGLRYHHSFVFPYMGPYLTWNEQASPTSGVVVSFGTSVACLGVVAWGQGQELTELTAGGERGFRHHIALTGLEAGASYSYRVHDCAGHSSEVFGFTTATEDAQSYRFAVLADMQDNGNPEEAWDAVAAQLRAEAPDAAFLLMPGDLACSDTPGSWWRFFDRARELFAHHPVVPVIGNHDTPNKGHDPDRSSFEDIFALPTATGSETFYTLDWGSAHLVVLDSEVLDELVEPGHAQRDWLEAELAEGAHRDGWVFLSLHEPIYNLGRRFVDVQLDYRPLSALFDGAVDWVFTGHEHIYQRMVPLRYDAVPAPSGEYGRGETDGVGYIVVPTAGDDIFEGAILPHFDPDAEDRAWLAAPIPGAMENNLPSEMGFTVVSVDGQDLELTTWGMGTLEEPAEAHVVDSVSYTRGAR